MAKAKKEEKAPGELTDAEREEAEVNHQNKHRDLDEMIAKRRRQAERMERINPRAEDYPDLTLKEIEDLETELPEEFDDTVIEELKVKKGLDKKIKSRRDKRNKDRLKRNKNIVDQILKTDEGQDIISESETPTPGDQ